MIVNVAVPTYKPDNKLLELIKRLNMQTLKPQKIFLVNTAEEYMDVEAYEQFNNISIVHISKEEFDHGGTRDMIMKTLQGDYTVLMTQDALPADRYVLEKLIMPMEQDESIAVTYARQLPAKDCGVIERYTRQFNYGDEDILVSEDDIENKGIKAYFCSDVCAAYRMNCYDEVGGFPGKTIFNEDMVYASKVLKHGYKKLYVSSARVIHSHNYTALMQFKRNFDLGVSHRQFSYIFNKELKTENEGIKLVKNTIAFLMDKGYWYLIPKLIIHSGAKYVGYRLGKMYDRLPESIVEKCTANKSYWMYK